MKVRDQESPPSPEDFLSRGARESYAMRCASLNSTVHMCLFYFIARSGVGTGRHQLGRTAAKKKKKKKKKIGKQVKAALLAPSHSAESLPSSYMKIYLDSEGRALLVSRWSREMGMLRNFISWII